VSRAERIAVLAGDPCPDSRLRPEDLADRVASLGEGIGLRELRGFSEVAEILWLPPWALLDEHLALAIERFLSGGAPCASVSPVLRDPDATIRLPRVMLVARPGSAEVRGGALAPRSGSRPADLGARLEIRPPGLSAHLRGIDRQATVTARLLEESGTRASGARLALVPLGRLVSAMARSSGDRRAALSRATLESFREVLVQAKLWERRWVDAGVP
jgi:hypothetical protein